MTSPDSPRTPELLILSRKKAEVYEPSGREACISITDTDDEPLPRLSSAFVAVLRVAFSDIDESGADPSEVLFNEHHARQVTECRQLDGSTPKACTAVGSMEATG